MLIKWNNEYSVDISLFDEHHQNLIQIINNLHEAMKNKKGRYILITILQELIDYTDYHFQEEEKYMQKIRYPEFEKHKKEHERFFTRISKYMEELPQKKIVSAIELQGFLIKWLLDHINISDKKYSEFLKNNN